MADAGLKTIAQQFIQAIPYAQALGMTIEEIGDGVAVMSVPYRAEFVGDPGTGVLAGGVVTALLDTCSGAAVMAHAVRPLATATIDLRIDYMRPAKPGLTVRARAECFRVTQSVAFVRALAHTDDPDRPVATAAGAFTVERGAKG